MVGPEITTMAGRKPLPEGEGYTVRIEIRMRPDQADKLAQLAGSKRAGPDWIRHQIDKARLPKTEAPAKPAVPWRKAG